jgi:glycosyltransferase involved in cell wall biosynthesis
MTLSRHLGDLIRNPLNDPEEKNPMRAQMTPRVSIGLPVYNGENFVGQAIASLLAQTFEDLELIISDNASTDRTEDICRDFAAHDRRIRYTRNARTLAWLGITTRYLHCHPERFGAGRSRRHVDRPSQVRARARPESIRYRGVCSSADDRFSQSSHKGWEPREELSSSRVERRFRGPSSERKPFPCAA